MAGSLDQPREFQGKGTTEFLNVPGVSLAALGP